MSLDDQVRRVEVKAAIETAARLAGTMDHLIQYSPLSTEGKKAAWALLDEQREQLRIAWSKVV